MYLTAGLSKRFKQQADNYEWQAPLELAPRHKFLRAVASSDILKFRVSKMAFSGVFKRRGILHHRGCHVVSSEYAQDWEQCRRKDCRNVPGALFERFTDLNTCLNQFKYAFNVNQNWEQTLYNFLFLYREVSHGHATGFCRTVSFKKENKYH